MEHWEDQSLWAKLKQQGFTCKVETIPLTMAETFKSWFDKSIKAQTKVNPDWLVNIINGKLVEVCAVDIWYTNVRVDGEVIFDARRFDDKDLFDAIEEATIVNFHKELHG